MKRLWLGVALIVLAPLAPARAEKTCDLTERYFIRTLARETIPAGAAGLGETLVMASAISRTPFGEQMGLNIARITKLGLAQATPGPRDLAEATVTNILPDGVLVSLQIVDSDHTQQNTRVERPIIGGTGKYRGARGIFIRDMIKVDGRDAYSLEFKISVQCE